MAEFETVRRVGSDVRTAEIDEGLRTHMSKIYGLMAAGLLVTGAIAWVIGVDLNAALNGQPTGLIPEAMIAAMYGSALRWVIMLSPLAFILVLSFGINKLSAGTAHMLFYGFAALMGLSLASVFAIYTGVSIAQTFLVTAIAFSALSLYGYTTKKDLSGLGTFLFMGLIGIIVASLLNFFIFESSALQFAISVIGLLVFAGLTAYDTQNLKNEYLYMVTSPEGQVWLQKAAVLGALSLYLNFVNMFQFLLMFLGDQE